MTHLQGDLFIIYYNRKVGDPFLMWCESDPFGYQFIVNGNLGHIIPEK